MPNCDKRHPDTLPGFKVIRCRHGKIGINQYAIVEVTSADEPNQGYFVYSVIPSENIYSMVCMWGYQDASQELRDSMFRWLRMQLEYGHTPLEYVMYCDQDRIVKIKGSDECIATVAVYSARMGSPVLVNGTLLYGRIDNPESN